MAKPHGMKGLSGQQAYCTSGHQHQDGDRFGRMFPQLPPLYTDPKVLAGLGAADGPMREGTPARTQSVEVGQVFLGQFIDHDVTLDVTSSFEQVNAPEQTPNARTPTLDLDCVYGAGPEASPALYVSGNDPFAGVKLLTGADFGDGAHAADDLPRVNNVALIGDPRNDENRLVSQVHLAMIRLHNRFCDALQGQYAGDAHGLFEAARQETTWHYQWVVVHDFLVKMCGSGVMQAIMGEGRQWYRPNVPFIPVEFSVAAYRFGHSMAPMRVQVRQGDTQLELFGTTLGTGFSPVPSTRAVCEMYELFDTHDGTRQVARCGQLDGKLAADLLNLPFVSEGEASLAARNLHRGQSFLLPSGENIARTMGLDEMEIATVTAGAAQDAAPYGGLPNGTPLWYYILKEAELIGRKSAQGPSEPGEGLGPLGARIVGEVMMGLIERDPRSWLAKDRQWQPKTYRRISHNSEAVELSTAGNLLVFGNGELDFGADGELV